jgi:hypothetical protein
VRGSNEQTHEDWLVDQKYMSASTYMCSCLYQVLVHTKCLAPISPSRTTPFRTLCILGLAHRDDLLATSARDNEGEAEWQGKP